MQNQYVNADSTVDQEFVSMLIGQFDKILPFSSNPDEFHKAAFDLMRFMFGFGQ